MSTKQYSGPSRISFSIILKEKSTVQEDFKLDKNLPSRLDNLLKEGGKTKKLKY